MKKPVFAVALAWLVLFTFGCRNKADKAELEKFRAQAALEEQNAAWYRQYVEAWNKGDFESLTQRTAPDYACYVPSANATPASREENVAVAKYLREAFPDAVWTIEDLVAVGDLVVTRNIIRGTHRGTFEGVPPTGNKIQICFIIMSRIRDGLLVEDREDGDFLGLMRQLGLELRPKDVKK